MPNDRHQHQQRTTMEQAALCARCGKPGEQTSQQPGRNSRNQPVKILMFTCKTGETDQFGYPTPESCPWFGTSWPVQVDRDGTIPVVDHTRDLDHKKYATPPVPTDEEQRVLAAIQRQLNAETKPGGAEIRNPNSPR